MMRVIGISSSFAYAARPKATGPLAVVVRFKPPEKTYKECGRPDHFEPSSLSTRYRRQRPPVSRTTELARETQSRRRL